MSEPLNPDPGKTGADYVSKIDVFDSRGLLPHGPKDVAFNYRQQLRTERQIELAVMHEAWTANRPFCGAPCMQVLHVTLCFDGTNNHEPSDAKSKPPTTSNVARLYHSSLGPLPGQQYHAGALGFYRYYIPGVGTEFKEIGEFEPSDAGLKYGTGGENRINWGLTRLLDALQQACGEPYLPPEEASALVQQMGTSTLQDALGASLLTSGHARRQQVLQAPLQARQEKIETLHRQKAIPLIKAMRLYVYGFSRGAAEARAFARWLEDLTQVEVAGETCYLLAGIPVCIAFLGLFDTVASVGMAYVLPFAAGHMGWADGTLRLSDSEKFLERCVHFVSAHEQRGCFPVDSIRRKADPNDPDCPSTYRTGTVEYVLPGVHSDVGGGYPPGDQGKSLGAGKHVLSQIALHYMYAEAYAIGAPLQAPRHVLDPDQIHFYPWIAMEPETADEFDVSDTLITTFNTWQSTLIDGPLEDVLAHQAAQITGWRIHRYANQFLHNTQGYHAVYNTDMKPHEAKAFAALHQRQLQDDMALRKGETPAPRSETEQARHADLLQIKADYEKRLGLKTPINLNTSKAFEPLLDQRQLDNAMADFRRDYIPEWGLREGGEAFSTGTLINALAGGLVYLTNEQDEAAEYSQLRRMGNRAYHRLFDEQAQVREGMLPIVQLYDQYVHDSRAWFMNAALKERELFSDYFRYRCIFFDNESNKALSLLATAAQVLGVAVAVGSIGLSVQRKDPRYLVGLLIPSLGIPVYRGKLGAPVVTAFDSLTGLKLPMQELPHKVRAFTQQTGAVLELVKTLAPTEPLGQANATTADLQKVLAAYQALEPVVPKAAAEPAAPSAPGQPPRVEWLEKARGNLEKARASIPV
ncbi:T6SS phospholipase effector Tle1-like catalytic domain-containing protein [Pseudomonas sp. M47T1]|uniref:T6SS phospholipase effector Tle1-like catalytic domain-containing protein n=1 Tax=Pseudomonas sp. M47T1 TaxID=1179778 RepID=UPI0005BC4C12|nr:DUF2235 domain-containing protein [Pseudomonas sp. M47T1]